MMRVIKLSVETKKPEIIEVNSFDEAEQLVPGLTYTRCTTLDTPSSKTSVALIVNDDLTAFATKEECEKQRNGLAKKFTISKHDILCDSILCKVDFSTEDDILLDFTDEEIERIIKICEGK